MEDHFRRIAFWAGLALAIATGLGLSYGLGFEFTASVTAAVTVLCAVWWSTEAIPIPVTSLVPFAVLPLAGVVGQDDVAAAYGNPFVLLFLAGFMLSRAAEKWDAHLRVAHGIMHVVGTNSPRRLVIGFMLAVAFCSMWISNTATALIMLPVAIAVLAERPDKRFGIALLLAVAYGSSIGGIATIIGTPPNGVFVGVYEQTTGRSVDFLSWMKLGLPVAVLLLVVCGVVLTWGLKPSTSTELKPLGPWTSAQRRVLAVFAVVAMLWIFRAAPAGGWSSLSIFADADLSDATVGFVGVLAMFLIPAGSREPAGPRQTLLDWETARDIPWGILLLFAGGILIAKAFGTSGLAEHVAAGFGHIAALPPLVTVLLICLVVTFLTEVTSNTATTTLLMPILAATADGAGLEPSLLMIPAAMSASCAFMLPVATPPNAIVFAGTDRLTIPDMVRRGVVLNLLGAIVIALCCYFLLDGETGLLGK